MLYLPSCAVNVKLARRSEADLGQTSTNLQDQRLIFFEGDEGERRELKVTPLLLNFLHLPVHVLLDLLLFLVQLDQLSGADGLVVGVDASASLNDIENCFHVIGRLVDKAILGSRMTTRDRLARLLLNIGSFDGKWRFVHLGKGHDTRGPISHDGRYGGCWAVLGKMR